MSPIDLTHTDVIGICNWSLRRIALADETGCGRVGCAPGLAQTGAEYDFVRNSTTMGHGLTAVRLGGQGDLTSSSVVWNFKKSYPSIPAPLIYRGVMYLMKEGGIVSSLDPASGQVLKQGRTPDALEEYYASPVAADGKIFLASASGKVTVLKADAQWEIIATNNLDDEIWATPAIAGNNLYIRTRNALYSFSGNAKQ